MPYTGSEDHSISLQTAAEWTENYRDTISQGETIAYYFGRDALDAILAQQGCVGIRIYLAINDQDTQNLVIVGVNSDGNDLYEGELAERALQSPPWTSSANPLNS